MQLRLTEACGCDFGPCRQGRKGENIGDDSALDLERNRPLDSGNRDRRVWREALSNPFGVGNRELLISDLQTAIVEESDLHCCIGGQCPTEKTLNCDAGDLGVVGRADCNHVLFELVIRDVGHEAHAPIRRKPSATGNQHR